MDDLVGTWLWLDSSGGVSGTTITPASAGYELTLRFSASDEVELLRDGTSQARTRFTHFFGDDRQSDHIRYDEPLFGFESAGVVLIEGDTLLLIDPCCDGFTRRWVR